MGRQTGVADLKALLLAAVAIVDVALANVAVAGDGSALFAQNCTLCHQAGATGLPGQFPRLAGRVAAISTHADGRLYLADVLTYGLSGTVTVDNEQIIGLMPPFAVLPDDVVADILSYVQTLGDRPKSGSVRPFSEQEIAAARAKSGKSLEDVQAERRALQRAKVIE
jgi:mono/diheme cytochrome c family protein